LFMCNALCISHQPSSSSIHMIGDSSKSVAAFDHISSESDVILSSLRLSVRVLLGGPPVKLNKGLNPIVPRLPQTRSIERAPFRVSTPWSSFCRGASPQVLFKSSPLPSPCKHTLAQPHCAPLLHHGGVKRPAPLFCLFLFPSPPPCLPVLSLVG